MTAERCWGTELGQQRDGGGQSWDSREMVGDRAGTAERWSGTDLGQRRDGGGQS